MKDYRVEVKVRNNYLLTAMNRAGYWTAADLSRASGVNRATIYKYLSLEAAPIGKRGKLSASAERLAEFLRCTPDMLFPPQHLDTPLGKARAEIEMSIEDIQSLLSGEQRPDMLLEHKTALESIEHTLSRGPLTPREETILRARFGIDGEQPKTLDEIAARFDLSRERIRGIETAALTKLRHPAQRRLREAAETLGIINRPN